MTRCAGSETSPPDKREDAMSKIDIRRVNATGAIEVVVPAEIAFDIEALFEVQKSIFERAGHPGCYSGADIRFRLEREFLVGVDRQIKGVAAGD